MFGPIAQTMNVPTAIVLHQDTPSMPALNMFASFVESRATWSSIAQLKPLQAYLVHPIGKLERQLEEFKSES